MSNTNQHTRRCCICGIKATHSGRGIDVCANCIDRFEFCCVCGLLFVSAPDDEDGDESAFKDKCDNCEKLTKCVRCNFMRDDCDDEDICEECNAIILHEHNELHSRDHYLDFDPDEISD